MDPQALPASSFSRSTNGVAPDAPAPSHDGAALTDHARADHAAAGGDDLVARVVVGLHGAVDELAGKVAPLVDRVKGGYGDAAGLPREWTDAARTAIRGNPIGYVGGALVVGAALLYLMSSSKR